MLTLAAASTLQGSATTVTTITYTITGMELAGTTETYKKLAQGQLPAATAALYTVPGATTGFVKEIHFTNTGSASQTITLYVDGTAAANELVSFVIPGNGFATYNGEWAIFDNNGVRQEGNSYSVPWYDVTRYGADASGTADSTGAIQQAINAAGRGTVYFPAGSYRISGTLTISDFTRLLGPSALGAFLFTTSTTADMISVGQSGVTIENLWLWAWYTSTSVGGTLSGTPQTIATSGTIPDSFPASGTVSIALTAGTYTPMAYTSRTTTSFVGCTGTGAFSAGARINLRSGGYAISTSAYGILTFRNVRCENQYNGMQLGGVNVTVTDSQVYDSINFGIRVTTADSGPTLHNVVMDNRAGAKPVSCIEVETCGVLMITSCQFIRGQNGMRLSPVAPGIYSIFAQNTFFDSCTVSGFAVTGTGTIQRSVFTQCWFSSSVNGVHINNPNATGIDLRGCHIFLNSGRGIYSQACAELSVTDTRMSQNTTAGVEMVASTPAPDISLTGNVIGAQTGGLSGNGTGIIIGAGAYANLQITGNALAGNTGAAITDNGATVANPGQRQVVDNTGLSVAPAPMIATPATFGLTETAITTGGQVYFPANSLLVGTTVKVTAFGIISATTPTLLARLRIGTLGTTGDTQVCATPAVGVTSGTGWWLQSLFTVRSIGAGGTCLGNIVLEGTAPGKSAQTATVAVNTTVANFLTLTLVGGGTSPVVTVVQAFAEIVRQ